MSGRNRLEFRTVDTPLARTLCENLWQAVALSFTPADVAEHYARQTCPAENSHNQFFYLDLDGSVVGMLALTALKDPALWEIKNFAIVKAWRRGGLGQFLLEKIGDKIRERGGRRLCATLHTRLPEAGNFFAKNHFIAADIDFSEYAQAEEIPARFYTMYRDL